MKKILCICLVAGFMNLSLNAQQLKTPAPSPTQTLKQDFALSNIELNYSRPSVKGRAIFGDLVPYGTLWRTGANSATTITFGDTVLVGGKKINPGKYGLLTIPGASEWTIIISKSTSTTSPEDYKIDEDVVRVMAKPEALGAKVETFTMQVANITGTSCEVQLMWDKTMVSLPVRAEIDARIMKDIDKLVVKDSRPYYAAAFYYLENGKDLNMALTWFDKAIEMNPKAYWVVHQKANCYAKMGKKAEAVQTANKSIEIAKAENDDHYVKLNEKLIQSLK